MQSPTISYLTKVQFGVGALSDLAEVLQTTSICRPLVVTDQGLRELGFVEQLALDSPAVFSAVPGNPTESCVMQGAELYRTSGCDGIIGLGGGSPIDAAKAIGIMAAHDLPLEETAYICGGLNRITENVPPLIAIPTTAGTGTEVGRAALVCMDSGRKLAIISPHIIPDWAIVDPALTLGLPPLMTAATGLDALSHCLETYCSTLYNPVAGAIALDGLKRGWMNLPLAVHDGENLVARTEMMMCAMQGALAFQKGLGLIHAVSHPLGAVPGKTLHHGTLNSVFMPHVIRFNATAASGQLAEVVEVLQVSGETEGLAQAFTGLSESMGLPLTLAEMGVEEHELHGIAEAAMEDHCGLTNPRKLTVEAIQDLLRTAWGG